MKIPRLPGPVVAVVLSASVARDDAVNRDLHRAELLSIAVTLLVLLFAFGAVVAALVPVVLALTGVIAAFGLLGPLSQAFPIDDAVKTVMLLIANVVAFLLECFRYGGTPHFPPGDYLALSWSGLKSGYVWQLITFQFLHAGIWHLIFNCWAIYMFGREVEIALGAKRFLVLYFSSGVVGGLFQALAGQKSARPRDLFEQLATVAGGSLTVSQFAQQNAIVHHREPGENVFKKCHG